MYWKKFNVCSRRFTRDGIMIYEDGECCVPDMSCVRGFHEDKSVCLALFQFGGSNQSFKG